MTDSRDIDDLQPVAAAKCRAVMAAWTAAGLDPEITTTLRTLAESARLFALGRTVLWQTVGGRRVPQGIVSNARPGQSFHNWGVAWDAYPRINGVILWSYADTPPHRAAWDHMGAIAEAMGIEWGHRWHSIDDVPHWQWAGGHPLSFFQAGGKL